MRAGKSGRQEGRKEERVHNKSERSTETGDNSRSRLSRVCGKSTGRLVWLPWWNACQNPERTRPCTVFLSRGVLSVSVSLSILNQVPSMLGVCRADARRRLPKTTQQKAAVRVPQSLSMHRDTQGRSDSARSDPSYVKQPDLVAYSEIQVPLLPRATRVGRIFGLPPSSHRLGSCCRGEG